MVLMMVVLITVVMVVAVEILGVQEDKCHRDKSSPGDWHLSAAGGLAGGPESPEPSPASSPAPFPARGGIPVAASQ